MNRQDCKVDSQWLKAWVASPWPWWTQAHKRLGVEEGDATAGGNGASGTTASVFCRATSVRLVANRHCCRHLSASLFLYLPGLSECRKRRSPASSMAKVLVFVAGTNVVHLIRCSKSALAGATQRSLRFETVKLPSLEFRGILRRHPQRFPTARYSKLEQYKRWGDMPISLYSPESTQWDPHTDTVGPKGIWLQLKIR